MAVRWAASERLIDEYCTRAMTPKARTISALTECQLSTAKNRTILGATDKYGVRRTQEYTPSL